MTGFKLRLCGRFQLCRPAAAVLGSTIYGTASRSLICAAGITVTAVALVPMRVQAQEGQTISEIVVTGVVKTNQQVPLSASGFKVGDVFTNMGLAAARRNIPATGYYSNVLIRTDITADKKLRVIIDVTENPIISNIVITGNKSIPSSKLLPLIRTKPGEVLNTNEIRADIDRILDYYNNKKGFFALTGDEAEVDPKTHVLTIPIIETIIESIKVTGNTKTKTNVILREFRSKPGSVFNQDAIRKDLRHLLNTGLFANVGPIAREPGSDLGKAVLTVPVVEQRTGQVSVVFGYSQRERLTGTLQLSESNFGGRGQTANFSWTVGGVVARNSFEVGFTEPWIDKKNTSVSFDLYDRIIYRFNRILTSNVTAGSSSTPYYENRQGGAVTFSRPSGDTLRNYITFRAETIKANNLRINYPNLSDDDIRNLRGSLISKGNVFSVTLRSARNTRDYDLDPVSGFYFSPSIELGTGNFNYEKPNLNPAFVSSYLTPGTQRLFIDERSQNGGYTKLNLDARRYLSLNGPRTPGKLTEPKRVFATRLLLGAATGNIGFSEQYFLGGAETLRGYADDRFWGNNLLLFNGELRLPLDKQGTLNGALFVDIGDAWGGSDVNRGNITDFKQHQNFRPNTGFGFGIRIKTPVGPVRLDYGIGETSRTHFSIGQTF